MGPVRPRSTVLTEAEEAIVVEFRRRTLLPLDDVLGCLRESIPKLTRSALHRCLVRHGISRLPKDGESTSKRGRFAETRIGYVHIDHCELRLAEGKLHMFLAIDRVSKFTYVAFFDAATKMNGAAFLREVIAAFPYAIHTVLTDNGMAFADLPKNRNGPTRRWLGAHIFDRVCREHSIEHRLTKPYHPWTNGQAERMNRTVKDATVKVFHYPDLDSLKAHVLAFVTAYNFAKHLKRLRWRTPFQAVCDAWTRDPAPFKINPHHLTPGPHTFLQSRHSGPGQLRMLKLTRRRVRNGWESDIWRLLPRRSSGHLILRRLPEQPGRHEPRRDEEPSQDDREMSADQGGRGDQNLGDPHRDQGTRHSTGLKARHEGADDPDGQHAEEHQVEGVVLAPDDADREVRPSHQEGRTERHRHRGPIGHAPCRPHRQFQDPKGHGQHGSEDCEV
jgi:hypothetical protein